MHHLKQINATTQQQWNCLHCNITLFLLYVKISVQSELKSNCDVAECKSEWKFRAIHRIEILVFALQLLNIVIITVSHCK